MFLFEKSTNHAQETIILYYSKIRLIETHYIPESFVILWFIYSFKKNEIRPKVCYWSRYKLEIFPKTFESSVLYIHEKSYVDHDIELFPFVDTSSESDFFYYSLNIPISINRFRIVYFLLCFYLSSLNVKWNGRKELFIPSKTKVSFTLLTILSILLTDSYGNLIDQISSVPEL